MGKASVRIVLCTLFLLVGMAFAQESDVALHKEQVSGWVLDPAGEAIAASQVILVVGKDKFEAESDEIGHFLFTGVPEGQSIIMVQKEGYKPEQLKLEIGNGEEVKIVLEALPQKPGFLAGQVLDAQTGQGIYRVEVTAQRLSVTAEAKPPVAWTDAKGYWRLSLPPGKYLITVRHMQYEEYKEQVEVISGEVVTLGFKLIPKHLPPAFLHGQVQTRGQQGLFLMPVADARVILAMENQSKWEIATDSAGIFQLATIPSGWGLVLVSKVGYKPWQQKVQLKAGENFELSVFLEPLPVQDSLLYGQVKDMKTGRPVAFAKIQAFDFEDLSLEPRYVVSDNLGNYKLSLNPGKHLLEVHHPDYLPKQEPVELFFGQNLRLDFLLKPIKQEPSTFVGKVYQVDSNITLPITDDLRKQPRNQPVEGAEVILSGEVGEYKTISGPDGWFEISFVEAGRYELLVRKDGYTPYKQILMVPAGEKIERFVPLVRRIPIILD